jgi:hypothetical protein
MQTAPPTVNFGLLEDLLEEATSDRRAEKLVEVRVTTNFTTRSGGGFFGEETTVWLVVTACTIEVLDQVALTRYAVWACRLVRFAEVHGNQASTWSEKEAATLADLAIQAVAQAIEERSGIHPKKGMYCLANQDWLTIRGGTNLVDLRPLYEAARPSRVEEGQHA